MRWDSERTYGGFIYTGDVHTKQKEKGDMEVVRSTPNELEFFIGLRDWMAAQKNRVWIVTPFIDKVGVSLINSAAKAEDVKVLTRRNRQIVDFKPGVVLKLREDLHVKLYIGDESAYIGSANLTANSLMDNIELLLKFEKEAFVSQLEGYFRVLWG